MANFIIFIIAIAILVVATSIALSVYLATEKGLTFKYGLMMGLLPIFGHIAIALKTASDRKVTEEMYERNLITPEDYEKTMEVVIKKEDIKK